MVGIAKEQRHFAVPSGKFAVVPIRPTEEATRVRYLRSSERRRSAESIQVWKSDLTGREFEVRESRSFASTSDLAPGTTGFLDFTSGAPAVTKRPLERSERLDRYRQGQRSRADSAGSNRRRSNLAGWILAGVLLAVIVLTLL
jgi:hypothetical protein